LYLDQGGGFHQETDYVYEGMLYVSQCIFVSCYCYGSAGGAVASRSNLTEFVNTIFLFCEALGIEDSTFAGGGALRLWRSGVNCTNCSFINCGTNNFGGAVCVSRSDYISNIPHGKLLNFSTCIFGSNQAAYDGGAILNLQADLKCENCSFLFNQAGMSGGAIACEFYGRLTFSDCVFVQNVVTDSDCGAQGKGGAIMLWYLGVGPREMKFENCLFYENLLNAWDCLGFPDVFICDFV
jgi:hypothetical protein